LQMPPRYTATAVLTLNTRNSNVVNITSVMAGLPLDANVIKSEIDVIESRALVARVISDLKLQVDPEFAPAKPGTGLLAAFIPLCWLPPEWRLAITGNRAEPTPTQAAVISQSRTTDKFLRHLSVSNDLHSYSISVSFQSRDPEKAARIANAVIDQ